MANYTIPEGYYLPLHHPRPRFKNEVENVLGYMAFAIADIGKLPRDAFKQQLNAQIKKYGSNVNSQEKTINNWRTEIGAIFGLYVEDDAYSRPTFQSEDLAINTNLPRFFCGVMAAFQYPAGFLKPDEDVLLVKNKVKFHPGRWLADFFLQKGVPVLTKEEFCHCVMNDLRVTRDGEPLQQTISRITTNRNVHVKYDSSGDVVRYAGDILDYMFYAGLLDKDAADRYFPKSGSAPILNMLKNSTYFFDKYYDGNVTNQVASSLEYDWFIYAENVYKDFVGKMDEAQRSAEVMPTSAHVKPASLPEISSTSDTAAIGKVGEMLALQHEILRVTKDGRKDLAHLIKAMPTHLAVGYDIKSIETDTEDDRLIEVKTCVTRKRVHFNNFHLSPNEWRVADAHGKRYYVYRIAIDDQGYQLFVIRDPVQKFRERLIRLSFSHPVQLNFEDMAGQFEELLCAPTK